MDRVIEKKKWTPRKIFLYIGIPVLVLSLLGLMILSSGGSKLRVPRERLTIGRVEKGAFQEFIPINGEVLPIKTVFVTAVEGGQVKEVFLEGGEMVEKGDIILRLTNPGLELNYMNLQTNLLEQADQLRNTKITLETSYLTLKDQLATIEFQVADLGQQYSRTKPLYEEGVISEQEYLSLKHNFAQARKRRELMLERIYKDSVLREQQLDQVDKSLSLVARNLNAIQRALSNLTITAPVSGQLSSVRVEIGETVDQGQRLSEVDVLDGYMVRASIDEHYISRIHTGLNGEFTFSGEKHPLVIEKVYPEVTNGTFEVDMEFTGEEPSGIKRGQNLQIRLALSEETTAVLIPRGGFYQSTGGNYIYVLSDDGQRAHKRGIRIGRQSDRHYEVLEGLNPGEQVITSNYEVFNDADELILSD